MSSGIELFLRTIIARAYPRVVGTNREKSWLFFDTFLPLLSTAAYVFFYRAIGAPEEYIGLVVVGGAMIAYWLESLRRAALGPEANPSISPSLSGIGDGQLLLILAGVTLIAGVISIFFFRWSEHRAREKGRIDMTTQY